MSVNGYTGGQLFSFRYGAYSVVVAARNVVEAGQAMILFLNDRGSGIQVNQWPYKPPRVTKSVGDRYLIIAHPTPGT